ncbi:hypothetical protein IQ06DRAFT_105058 [Phaeosphaeriaceae sp. SRC1lsM3a]|nr:hypothetical protein IQ06DRAFT_105058 [Stagonospora sp. SRC1lsM3a]
MALTRRIPTRSSKDGICDAMQLSCHQYDSLYFEVEREMKSREMFGQSLRTTTAREHIRQIAMNIVAQRNNALRDTPIEDRIRTITHLAVRCNHNATRRMRSRRTRLQRSSDHDVAAQICPKFDETVQDGAAPPGTVSPNPGMATILVSDTTEEDRILIRTRQLLRMHGEVLTDKDITKLNYQLFVHALEEEVGFDRQRSGIFYYAQMPGGWTRIRISTEARWHGALQDAMALKLQRASFVIEPLSE